METAEMVWTGALRKDMVENWTDEQITTLCIALDEAISNTVDTLWAEFSKDDPIVRETLIGIVGVDNAVVMMEEGDNNA